MTNVRKRHTAEFKAKVAVEAIRQQKTTNELVTEYGILAPQISAWKKQALAAIPLAFSNKQEAWLGLRDYFGFYNHHRLHQSLDYRTPAQVYLAERQDGQLKTDFYQPAVILIS